MYYDPRVAGSHGLPHDPITALVLPRPIGWISTLGPTGAVNLAPYSYFNLVAGKPPFVMFASEPAKDSQKNAEATGEFVFNLATWDLCEEMNVTGASLARDQSEAEIAGLEMTASTMVKPPRVARSPVALECRYVKTVDLVSGAGVRAASTITIGEVVGVHVDDSAIVDGVVDVRRLRPIARLGYFQYGEIGDVFVMVKPP